MDNDFILVLDCGGPEAVEMARKLRNQRCYTEILPAGADAEALHRKSLRGILVVGERDAFPRFALEPGVPVLAMGGAARRMIEACGAASEGVLLSDQASQIAFSPCPLFDGLTESDRYFSRVDGFALPAGFESIATTLEGFSPAFADLNRQMYGLQFYPESNDPDGAVILSNFAEKICGCAPEWTMERFIDDTTREIRETVGEGHALMAISGGVDSSACAMLMKRAIGDNLTCVFIDNGLLRAGEPELVYNTFDGELGFRLIRVDARERMLNRLKGVSDSADKRRVIYDEFMAILSEVGSAHPEAEYFVEGTIYSDLIREGADEAHTFSTGAGKRLEPIRTLFKDEVRQLGELLGLPRALTTRQSFPGAGLAIRCMGEVTGEKLDLLRRADAIFREEIHLSGQDRRLTHYFVVLDDVKTAGRRDGARAAEYACALRAVTEQGVSGFTVGKLPYDLLDRVASRVIREVRGVNRVSYDISPCDNSDIEWG